MIDDYYSGSNSSLFGKDWLKELQISRNPRAHLFVAVRATFLTTNSKLGLYGVSGIPRGRWRAWSGLLLWISLQVAPLRDHVPNIIILVSSTPSSLSLVQNITSGDNHGISSISWLVSCSPVSGCTLSARHWSSSANNSSFWRFNCALMCLSLAGLSSFIPDSADLVLTYCFSSTLIK